LKGKSNREIADELDRSVRSIEARRAKVMQTMKARTLAALVRQALLVHGVTPSRSSPAPGANPWMQPAAQANELEPIVPRSHRSRPAK
jgi:hypothetical protein